MNNFQELTTLYLQDPCGIQANALWKTMKMLPNFDYQTEYENGKLQQLIISNDKMLHTYWHKDAQLKLNFDYQMMI